MKGPWRRNVFLYILVLLPKANKKGWERTYCLICWKGFLQRAFIIERANSIRIILHFYFKISNLTFDLPVSYGGSRLFKFWLLSSSLLVIFFGQIFFSLLLNLGLLIDAYLKNYVFTMKLFPFCLLQLHVM